MLSRGFLKLGSNLKKCEGECLYITLACDRDCVRVEFGRRGYSPGAHHRPGMRHDAPRDRDYYPGPSKKKRMDYYYQEPESRPFPKHVQRAPEPMPASAVIEKRPVLFHDNSKNVPEYQPLPQRKPVQRPRVVPQPQPTKPIEKPPIKPVEKQPVKPVQTQMKPVVKQPMKTIQKQPMNHVQQQPMKPVEKQPMKTVVEKQATTPNKATPLKQPTKPVQATSVQKQAPQVVQKNQGVKPIGNKLQNIKKEEEPPLGPCPEGYSQISDIMSRALSAELRDIMDLIAKELPNQAATPAERFVVKQFRTVVGDDIKKALGLNVTKRLLNIHNPLYVKLLFSGKPEAGCLQSFIKQYNISAFKRVQVTGDLFAARLDSVADFDCLCAAGELACGSAKVTVTPCYKYLSCPPMLHTIYGTYIKPEKAEKQTEDTVKSDEADKSIEGEKIKQEVTPKEGDNLAIKQEVNNEASANITNKHNVTDAKLAIKQEVNKEASEKITNKQNVTNAILDIKQEVNNEASEKITIKEEVTDANDSDTKAKNSPIEINITIEAAPKNNSNKTCNENEIPIETAINKLTKEIAKPIKEEKDTKMKDFDDDFEEEMNDSDILSLMSGGIVLDECSGSDDEK